MKKNGLKRCLGLRESITITAGTVIGVGLFTVGANVVGVLGPSVFFATLAALLVSVYPALLYAEMGAALPCSGGTYKYASLGLGKPFGMLAGWCFIISMVSVASGEAMAFSFYLRTLLEALGFHLPFSDRWIACLIIAGFLLLAANGVQLAGRLQNGFLFFFWGVAAVWIFSTLPSMQFAKAASGLPAAPFSLPAFLSGVAMVWWCFAGFETCCAMGDEIRYPQINLPRALILAPFLIFAVNGLFQWALLGIVPGEMLSSLSEAAAPYAEGMKLAGITGFPLILLCLGIAFGGDFSTLNASVSAPARYLYTMAKNGDIPKWFGKLGRRNTPLPAILTLGGCMILLTLTDSISIIASLSLFATLLYYIIGIAAACGLRIKYPTLARPYKIPGIIVGAPVSILLYLLLITQLDLSAVLAGAAFCALGLTLFFVCGKKKKGQSPAKIPELPAAPTAGEKRKMDREFRIWAVAIAAAALLVTALYIVFLI